ncbi:MAG: nucleotidyltransferase domain-containing protein [Deltaproteobacteria bacterium]|nr:nucleotidyltransferase domain-containing protein [Deltaproteobacteria bacterium]
MKIDEKILKDIVQRILSVTKPERIILFGSAAMGTMIIDSDIDLLIVEPDFINQRKENIRLRSALGDIGIPVDIFAMTSERFDETKDIIGGLAYPANKYGKVIYEMSRRGESGIYPRVDQ